MTGIKQLIEELQGLYEAAQVDEKPYRRLLTDADLDFLVAVKEYLPRIRAALMAADELAEAVEYEASIIEGYDDTTIGLKIMGERMRRALNSYKEKVQE